MPGTDIVTTDTGNLTIYNGSIVTNPGVKNKTYFEYFRDRAIQTPVIADIQAKFSGDFDEIYFYNASS